MKLIDIVKQLQREGHSVEYRVRSDGGIIITKINDTKFKTIPEGNRLARAMTGIALSPARAVQTQSNIIKFIKGHKKPQEKVSENLRKMLSKAQRLWRKNQIGGTARPTMRKVRWRLINEGMTSAQDYLENMTKYAEGIANRGSMYSLIARLERLTIQFPEYMDNIARLINKLLTMMSTFKEDWIHASLEIIYDIEEYRMNIEDGLYQLKKMWK